MTKLHLDIEECPIPGIDGFGININKAEDKEPLSQKLWQLDKKLVDGHHYIKLSDALQLVSQKKLDQKL